MRKTIIIAVALLLGSSVALAGGEWKATIRGIRDILVETRWAATVPLYKTRVYEGGEVRNKPDDESIMPGQRVTITKQNVYISKRGEVKVYVHHPQGISSFYMRFHFNDRLGEDAEHELAAFRRMVSLVMEPMAE